MSSSGPCNAHIRIVRGALLTIMAVSAVVVELRTFFGPLTFPLKVTNPVNPEGWFGLALVLTMLVTPDAVDHTVATSRARI